MKPEPARRVGWRARYRDPDSGRMVKVTLEPEHAASVEARTEWAVKKSKELLVRRAQLDGGASRIVGSALSKAVDDYFKTKKHERRESTLGLYRTATDTFLEWAAARKISSSTELKATTLPRFRDYLLQQRKRSYVRKERGQRAGREEGREKLSPLTINWKLRAVKTVLNYLRARGVVPLSSDQIRDALKPVKVPKRAPKFMQPTELARLLEACQRHDSDVYTETREEHAGLRTKGTTAKYQPIAPFVATVLLTGMRFGEALALRWSAVDLEAIDPDGHRVGLIKLKAEDTKTEADRTVGLDVCPSLRTLLAALKLRSPRGAEYVFGVSSPMSEVLAEAARRRLVAEYGAPKFSWQLLRSTVATYQCNAPSLFGDAAAFRSAKRLGHSVTVSEKHYAGQFAVSRNARTLEQAMKIEGAMERVVASAGSVPSRSDGVALVLAR